MGCCACKLQPNKQVIKTIGPNNSEIVRIIAKGINTSTPFSRTILTIPQGNGEYFYVQHQPLVSNYERNITKSYPNVDTQFNKDIKNSSLFADGSQDNTSELFRKYNPNSNEWKSTGDKILRDSKAPQTPQPTNLASDLNPEGLPPAAIVEAQMFLSHEKNGVACLINKHIIHHLNNIHDPEEGEIRVEISHHKSIQRSSITKKRCLNEVHPQYESNEKQSRSILKCNPSNKSLATSFDDNFHPYNQKQLPIDYYEQNVHSEPRHRSCCFKSCGKHSNPHSKTTTRTCNSPFRPLCSSKNRIGKSDSSLSEQQEPFYKNRRYFLHNSVQTDPIFGNYSTDNLHFNGEGRGTIEPSVKSLYYMPNKCMAPYSRIKIEQDQHAKDSNLQETSISDGTSKSNAVNFLSLGSTSFPLSVDGSVQMHGSSGTTLPTTKYEVTVDDNYNINGTARPAAELRPLNDTEHPDDYVSQRSTKFTPEVALTISNNPNDEWQKIQNNCVQSKLQVNEGTQGQFSSSNGRADKDSQQHAMHGSCPVNIGNHMEPLSLEYISDGCHCEDGRLIAYLKQWEQHMTVMHQQNPNHVTTNSPKVNMKETREKSQFSENSSINSLKNSITKFHTISEFIKPEEIANLTLINPIKSQNHKYSLTKHSLKDSINLITKKEIRTETNLQDKTKNNELKPIQSIEFHSVTKSIKDENKSCAGFLPPINSPEIHNKDKNKEININKSEIINLPKIEKYSNNKLNNENNKSDKINFNHNVNIINDKSELLNSNNKNRKKIKNKSYDLLIVHSNKNNK